jgi:nucleotide-binding universal stress UspA family protein
MSGAVLLCFDGSQEAANAIRAAGGFFTGRDALVLTVAIPAKDELPLDPVGDLVGRISGLYRDWDEIATELAARQAQRGCELASEVGLDAKPLSAAGKPAATILRVADQHDVAVIVLGAGRHGALGGLLGSVSARVVEQARRPVLVISER